MRFMTRFQLATLVATGVLMAPAAQAVPSFARQTGMACAACHTVFPELTHFGRVFKANGYVLDNLKQVRAVSGDRQQLLSLSQLPTFSIMTQVSYTTLNKRLPDATSAAAPGLTQNGTAGFPQQLSLFYAGRIAPHFGVFSQITYGNDSGTIGIDNTDLRFAKLIVLPGKNTLTYGVSLNNNPTVQDLWNTVPAWYNPYMTSGSAPGPESAPLLDTLGGGVAGVTAYAMLNDIWYAEAGVYTSAPQGVGGPYDTAASTLISGGAPYWRFAGEWDWGSNSFEIGTYGMAAKTRIAGTCDVATQLTDAAGNPVNVYSHADGVCQTLSSGPTDDYVDLALDSQYQYIAGNHIVTLAGTWIHENATLHSTASAYNIANGTALTATSKTLNTARGSVSYYYERTIGGSVQFFDATGDANPLLYDSVNAKPDSNGVTLEVDYLPWLNTKFAVAYTMYGKFNGATHNYDGAGANASDNDTLYAYLWMAF